MNLTKNDWYIITGIALLAFAIPSIFYLISPGQGVVLTANEDYISMEVYPFKDGLIVNAYSVGVNQSIHVKLKLTNTGQIDIQDPTINFELWESGFKVGSYTYTDSGTVIQVGSSKIYDDIDTGLKASKPGTYVLIITATASNLPGYSAYTDVIVNAEFKGGMSVQVLDVWSVASLASLALGMILTGRGIVGRFGLIGG